MKERNIVIAVIILAVLITGLTLGHMWGYGDRTRIAEEEQGFWKSMYAIDLSVQQSKLDYYKYKYNSYMNAYYLLKAKCGGKDE